MNLEPDEQRDPLLVLAETVADVTIAARQIEALAQNTDIFAPAACRLFGALGGVLKSVADRLGNQVAPQLRPALLVKDGEAEQASTGIAGDPPPAPAEPIAIPFHTTSPLLLGTERG